MEWVLISLGAVCAIIALVCCIMVIVKMFQNNQTGLGIASIVGIFVCGIGYILTMIFGWQNKVAWGLQKVMPIYTLSLVLMLVFYGVGYGLLLPKLMEEMQQVQQSNSAEFEFDYDSDSPAFEP